MTAQIENWLRDFSPIVFPAGISVEDMRAIAAINRIALNSNFMTRLLKMNDYPSFGTPGAPKNTVESAVSAPNKADTLGLTQVEAVSKTDDGGANPSRPAKVIHA